ncbi:hypothetical protein ETB97_002399 [Aspergillus alliaceus]|uniref:Uncharacterized protein n=1 Tax=Petromyces alliaceus TaxID=209559 RepID=A0A8H6E552_PETAA|nr:hypothetical protein ETB97_002399 [Aspergillus burnettii]
MAVCTSHYLSIHLLAPSTTHFARFASRIPPLVTNPRDEDNPLEALEESERLPSDTDCASTGTHVQFEAGPDGVSDWVDRAATSGTEDPSAEDTQFQPADDVPAASDRELDPEPGHLQREVEERAMETEGGSPKVERPAVESSNSGVRSGTGIATTPEQRAAMEDTTLVVEARSDSVERVHIEIPTTPARTSSKKVPTRKDNELDKNIMWRPYDVTQKGNRGAIRRHRTDQDWRVTRVDFTEFEQNTEHLPGPGPLPPIEEQEFAAPADEPNVPGIIYNGVSSALEDRHIGPEIVAYPVVKQVGTPTQMPQASSEGLAKGQVSRTHDISTSSHAQPYRELVINQTETEQWQELNKEQRRWRNLKWMPYDSMEKANRKLAAGHNLGLKSTELQRPRPATRVDFTEFESNPVDQHERHAPSQPEIAENPEQVPLTYRPTFSSPHATSDREPSATPQDQSLRDVTESDDTTNIPPPTATPPKRRA